MQPTPLLTELKRELEELLQEAETIQRTIAALEDYQTLASRVPKVDETIEVKKRKQTPKVCAVCGYEAKSGGGLSAHMRGNHKLEGVGQGPSRALAPSGPLP